MKSPLDTDQKRLLAVQVANLSAKMLSLSEIAVKLGVSRDIVRNLKKHPTYQETYDSIVSEARNRAKGYLANRAKHLIEKATDALSDMLEDPDHRSKGINTVYKVFGLLDQAPEDTGRDTSVTVVLPAPPTEPKPVTITVEDPEKK